MEKSGEQKTKDPDAKIRSQLTYLKSLREDGLLPNDIYQKTLILATNKYLKSDDLSSNTSPSMSSTTTTGTSPPPTTTISSTAAPGRRRKQQQPQLTTHQILWYYGGPFVLLLAAIICGLITIEWILGVDRPRLFDYMLHPISTCSTHRTGRVDL